MALPTTTLQYVLVPKDGYKALAVQEVPIPALKSNDVLLKTHAASLNYRDLMIARNQYLGPPLSFVIPLSDMSGEVIAVGEDVKDFKAGDRVCPNFSPEHLDGDPSPATQSAALGAKNPGVLSKYKIFKPEALVKIPGHLSFEEAATLPCAALTAYNALHGPVPIKAGDFVLVQGTGGVSIAGLQLAVASGATVIATSSSDAKLQIAKKLGAKHLINYKNTPDWDAKVMRITGGRGVDHILEVGGEGTLEQSAACGRYAGWIHVIGLVSGLGASNIIGPCIAKGIVIRGIQIGSVAQFKNMNRVLETHPETTRPIVDKVFAWKDAKDAYAYLDSQAHVGKVVIKVSDD